MTHTIFNQPVQTTLEALRQPSMAEAQQLTSIKVGLAVCALIALLVIAFEAKIVYATFDMTFGSSDSVWKPWIMAFASLILVLAVHFIGHKNAQHPVIRFVNRAAAILIPVYLLGIGVLIVVTLYNNGLGEMLMSASTEMSLEAMLNPEPDSALDEVMTTTLTPLAGILFSVGIGSLAIVSVFVAHFALSKVEILAEKYLRISQAAKLDNRDMQAYQQAYADYDALQEHIDNLITQDDEEIREALADEVLISIQDGLAPTVQLINQSKYQQRPEGLLPPNQINVTALERAIKPIQSIKRKDILKHLV
ncbi:hypothetical protein [Oceanobacter antarcticus]|uniref:Uncharacterized protein n=1 Tax=Oceanobacter antarcticus TaxID=3133425 RepID=A0ABW8NJP1_9GAMM